MSVKEVTTSTSQPSTSQSTQPSTSTSNEPKLRTQVTLGYVAVQRTDQWTGSKKKSFGRAIPIRVRSQASEDDFVRLEKELSLPSHDFVGVTFTPVKGDANVQAPEASVRGLEFFIERIYSLGVVRTSDSRIVLLPINADAEEFELPIDASLVGIISAPVGTHEVWVDDRQLDQFSYRVGISFPNTVQPDWERSALDRRQEVLAERAEKRRQVKEEADAKKAEQARLAEEELERKREATKPVRRFATSDIEVQKRIEEEYDKKSMTVRTIADFRGNVEVGVLVEDPFNVGAAIAEAVAMEREKLVAEGQDPDEVFKRQREARREVEYARAVERDAISRRTSGQ